MDVLVPSGQWSGGPCRHDRVGTAPRRVASDEPAVVAMSSIRRQQHGDQFGSEPRSGEVEPFRYVDRLQGRRGVWV